MSGKIPASGFKSPAPVLPAMGLHSFHNDSPPFAPASQHAKGEPDHLSLAPSPSGVKSDMGNGYFGLSSTAAQASSNGDGGLVQPVPIRQKGFDTTSPLSNVDDVEGSTRPGPIRLPTTSADEFLSTSRSRRLLSGYMFGNPPSPQESVSSSPTKGNGVMQSLIKPEEAEDEKIPGYSNPSPPSQTRDSTPVSTISSSPDPHPRPPSVPAPPIQPVPTGDQEADQRLSSSVGTIGTIGAGHTVNEQIKAQDKEKEELRRRRMSRVRDKEIGYDALTGLDDGEADADDNAPQAAFGSQQYLLGAEGEAGEYRFPRHRLRTRMKDESKIPLVIVACGSFSPPTYLHLRMFEMAKDEVVESQTYEIMAGYYSPVSSYYKKSGLAPAIHRVRMCELAVEHTSTWLMVDPWEAGQPEYTRTAVVLEHFNEMLNTQGGGLTMSDGKRRKYKIMLLAGGDLIESFGEPGVWSEPDLHIILGRFGCLIVERAGSDVWAFLLSHDILYHHRRNVIVIKQLIYNDISSTKVRLFVKRGMSIKYLLPNSVIQYIYDNKLYR